MERPQTWYVYTYLLPDDTVFYVGKGTGNRINAHETEAAGGCPCRKCETIRGIWAEGKAVKKRIVFETLVESEALAREQDLIQEHAGEHLTNVRVSPVTNDVTPESFVGFPRAGSPLLLAYPELVDLVLRLPFEAPVTFTYTYDMRTGRVSDLKGSIPSLQPRSIVQ